MMQTYGGGFGGRAGMVGGGVVGVGGRAGLVAARGPAGNSCMAGCVNPGEEATACGVGCGGAGTGNLTYVGGGCGDYVQETTYQHVGHGGDFSRRRDFTCIMTTCCLLSLLLLIPLLLWLLTGWTTTAIDCNTYGENVIDYWPAYKLEFCCATAGIACPPEPTPPPTPPPTPITTQERLTTFPPAPTPPPAPTTRPPPNCAIEAVFIRERRWCCLNHPGMCTTPTLT